MKPNHPVDSALNPSVQWFNSPSWAGEQNDSRSVGCQGQQLKEGIPLHLKGLNCADDDEMSSQKSNSFFPPVGILTDAGESSKRILNGTC